MTSTPMERVLEVVDDECSPDCMDPREALDFLMDLIAELDMRASALSEEMELDS
jgi:hypothetical protein